MIPVKTFENPLYKGEWPIAYDRYLGQISIQFKDAYLSGCIYFKRGVGHGYSLDERRIQPDLPSGWRMNTGMDNNLLLWPGLTEMQQERLKTLVNNANYVLTCINEGVADVTWDDPTDQYFLQLREEVLEAERKFVEPIKAEMQAILLESDPDRARTVIMDTRKRSAQDAERRIQELRQEIDGLREGMETLNQEVII